MVMVLAPGPAFLVAQQSALCQVLPQTPSPIFTSPTVSSWPFALHSLTFMCQKGWPMTFHLLRELSKGNCSIFGFVCVCARAHILFS